MGFSLLGRWGRWADTRLRTLSETAARGAKDQGGWGEQERSWGQGGAEGGPSGEGWGLGQQASEAYKGPGGWRRGAGLQWWRRGLGWILIEG